MARANSVFAATTLAIAAIAAATLAHTGLASAAHAQGPRGAGPDARTPAAGTLRIGAAADWARASEEYNDGRLRPIGDRFTFARLGADAIRALRSTEEAARTAAGLPDFRASLGSVATGARTRFESTPISLEYGVTSKVAVGALVPFVTSIARVDLAFNATPGAANVGLNPALESPTIVGANAALLAQLDAASASLSQRIVSCTAAPAGPGCAPIVAGATSATALLAESAAFASAVAALYGGRAGSPGSPFIPLAGSAAHAAVAARLAGIKAQYAAYGAPAIQAGAPVGAPAPLTGAEFQRVLTDSAYGIMAHPLASAVRRGVGDIDFTAQYTWHDSYARTEPGAGPNSRFWWRSAVIGVFRLGSGAAADPADIIPVARGDRQDDLEVRSITDAGFGDRFSITAAMQLTIQRPAEYSVRVADARNPFPEAFRTITARRDPGDEMRIDVHPRWNASEAMSVAAHYGYRRKAIDAWSGTDVATAPDGSSITLAAAALDANTSEREHRFGASLAYSSLAAWERGRARWPVEIAFSHFQTTAGSGGRVPKVSYDQVQIRWYWRPFGRGGPLR